MHDWLSVFYKRGRCLPEECWGDPLGGRHRSWAGIFLPPDHCSVPVVPPRLPLVPPWCSSPGWASRSPPVTLGWSDGTHWCMWEGAGVPSWHREEIPPQRGISTLSSYRKRLINIFLIMLTESKAWMGYIHRDFHFESAKADLKCCTVLLNQGEIMVVIFVNQWVSPSKMSF